MGSPAIHISVMTSDGYLDALKPFLYLYSKYWRPVLEYAQPEVDIFGFTVPDWVDKLPTDIKFTSLGEFSDFPFNKWSDAFIITMDTLLARGITHSIIMLEDYWIVHPVNIAAIEHAWEYTLANKNIIKFDLGADRLYALDADLDYGKYKSLELIKSKPGSPYHLSMMTGIWNIGHLRSVMRKGWSPHDVELTGTNVLSQRHHLDVIGTHQWPIFHTLAMRGGDSGKLLVDEIKLKDREELGNLGLLIPWEVK